VTEPTLQPAVPGAAVPGEPWLVAAAQSAGSEPGWLGQRRAAALARLTASGLPATGVEDWRYTNLAGYTRRWAELLAAPAGSAVPPTPAGSGVQIIDGRLCQPLAGLPAGLTIRSAGRKSPTAADDALLRRLDAQPHDSLVDLNTALLTDVVLVTTLDGSQITAPVHIRLGSTGATGCSQPRVIVDLAPGSELTLILEHEGAGGALANAVTEIWVGRASRLHLIRIQSLPDDGMLTETTRIEVAESAAVTVTSVDLGGQLSRQSLTVSLTGRDASATIDGLFLADGRRHLDNRTNVEHRAPGTTSRETFRGIADHHGRGIFNGRIVVLPGAAGSTAALTNRNLLLAPTAEIDTKPELEIYVDDVRCSHGATTGQLDADALFYLRSRGLDPAAARQVLTAAFLRQGLESIRVPELRARLEARLQARLGGAVASDEAGTGQGSAP
jgi:Fe-S cluster assembly protein SufD